MQVSAIPARYHQNIINGTLQTAPPIKMPSRKGDWQHARKVRNATDLELLQKTFDRMK
jgi:hypothetical protein